MLAPASHPADLQQGSIQRYLLRQNLQDSCSARDKIGKMAQGQTPLKLRSGASIRVASKSCLDIAQIDNVTPPESAAPTAIPELTDTAHIRGVSAAANPPAPGGSSGFATTALLSAFRADFKKWASKMESFP